MMKLMISVLATVGVLALLLLVTGCNGKVVVQDRPVTVRVPVAQPCAGPRPEPVVPLKTQFTPVQLKELTLSQKAALVSKNALERKGYGEQLEAATASCP